MRSVVAGHLSALVQRSEWMLCCLAVFTVRDAQTGAVTKCYRLFDTVMRPASAGVRVAPGTEAADTAVDAMMM